MSMMYAFVLNIICGIFLIGLAGISAVIILYWIINEIKGEKNK